MKREIAGWFKYMGRHLKPHRAEDEIQELWVTFPSVRINAAFLYVFMRNKDHQFFISVTNMLVFLYFISRRKNGSLRNIWQFIWGIPFEFIDKSTITNGQASFTFTTNNHSHVFKFWRILYTFLPPVHTDEDSNSTQPVFTLRNSFVTEARLCKMFTHYFENS